MSALINRYVVEYRGEHGELKTEAFAERGTAERFQNDLNDLSVASQMIHEYHKLVKEPVRWMVGIPDRFRMGKEVT